MNNFQIIVPTLNSFGVLNKLIESLRIQTWRFWRVIFVDGESNYEHVSWLKYQCLKDKRFSYIKQRRENIGIFGAMNQGLEMADQKNWILFWGLRNTQVFVKIGAWKSGIVVGICIYSTIGGSCQGSLGVESVGKLSGKFQ